jgi:hypothetical protein
VSTDDLTADELADHDEVGVNALTVYLRIETFYEFAKILLNRLARLIPYYFGHADGVPLSKHRQLPRALPAFAGQKGLTLPQALTDQADELQRRISDYRDKTITHGHSPRTYRGTAIYLNTGEAMISTHRLYPERAADAPRQSETPGPPTRRASRAPLAPRSPRRSRGTDAAGGRDVRPAPHGHAAAAGVAPGALQARAGHADLGRLSATSTSRECSSARRLSSPRRACSAPRPSISRRWRTALARSPRGRVDAAPVGRQQAPVLAVGTDTPQAVPLGRAPLTRQKRDLRAVGRPLGACVAPRRHRERPPVSAADGLRPEVAF